MARNKPQFTPIANLDEANAHLGEIAELERELAAINHMMNESIDQAKAEGDAAADPLKARLEQLEAALAAYAEYNKPTLFANKKSVDLLFGTFGYRKSTSIKQQRGFKVADTIAKIKEYGFLNALRTKESLNKDVMAEWTDKQLDAVGAVRDERDSFWYEVKQEDAA